MTGLSVGHLASQALPAVSPWIIPVIAAAVTQTYGRARQAWRRGRPARCGDDAPKTEPRSNPQPRRSAPPPAVMHERFRARLEATIWPD
jgi:hypothetical protein